MSTENTNSADEGMTLRAPAAEGDGYYKAKALQWVDLCPHMGTAEKTLLRVLTNLTTKESPTRRLAPAELRQMVYSGPVEVGQAPKVISASGLLRLLRSLAEMGQITATDGSQLRFSSGDSAQLRGISMVIWRYPRHECGCARNAFDALAITKGELPYFGPASSNLAAQWPARPADQPGQEVNQPGQEVNQPGQEVNQPGQEVNPDSQSDQEKQDPPSSFSSSFSSSSSGAGVTPGTPQVDPKEEEEESPNGRNSGADTASDPVVDTIRSTTGADAAEADAVIDRLRERARKRGAEIGSIARYVAGFDKRDLTGHLQAVRRERATQSPTGAYGGAACALHDESAPCRACRVDYTTGQRDHLRTELDRVGAGARPDLAELLGEVAPA
ncbi:hypothetical protein HNR25_005177 [Streptomonospora salina]|uniref:Uncharacterized protein n=1 Tax=Streptomonospora salina TaxID=104205 RepID=A0A841EED1_9ACTN|nr:hypothetical protein [Streptomonospora salina]MBB6001346.1 hypothetical protein [Streptomonospora salina]